MPDSTATPAPARPASATPTGSTRVPARQPSTASATARHTPTPHSLAPHTPAAQTTLPESLLPRPSLRRSPWPLLRHWLPTIVTFLIVALLWQLVAVTNPYVLPTLPEIAASLVEDPAMYGANVVTTLLEIVVGAAIGIGAGFLLAIVMAEFRIIERAIMPLAVIVMVTPIVAIAPALVVAFGFGMAPKFIVTALVVFFPMLVNSLVGLRDVDQRALDVFTTLHASRWEIFRDLRLPGSMPYVFTGLRIALPLAVVGAAVAEFVAAGEQAGLGSLVTTSAAQANLPVTWASIALLCLLGVVLITVLAAVRARVLWWSEDGVHAR